MQRWWQQWDEQQKDAEDLEDKLALVQKALAEGPDPDDEFLIESFEPVMLELAGAGRHAEVVAMVDQLEARFPLGFEHSRASFVYQRFESAVELPGADWVVEMRTLGAHSRRLLRYLGTLPTTLAWEGRIEAMRTLMETGWPAIHSDDDLFEWAVDKWAAAGLGAVLLAHLQKNPELKDDDPALKADVSIYEAGAEDLDRMRTYVREWLRWLQGGPALPAHPEVLAGLGKKKGESAYEQTMNLVAVAATRLREKQGWSRGQVWVLLQAQGLLLADCAEQSREEKRSTDLKSLLLPPVDIFLERLEARTMGAIFIDYVMRAAVILALPAWVGLVIERGWAKEEQAHAWQQEVMRKAEAKWAKKTGAPTNKALQRMLAFARGEGRSREAWLLG